ncbi:hypothetical protein AK812_SmicGene20654 [Symbiodinium microadriaticum]|uniref:RNA-polymerase II-associated protein 3-like C-terminal domain-containing protein n=1 Tax=Symbiodinium microadriaticum TaxID=2951 RepID=A0A1Q9DPG9_SYMMI|nr:hypothetical protein AK812_SmicGene20654 [Symbiodinium microadriaticum]
MGRSLRLRLGPMALVGQLCYTGQSLRRSLRRSSVDHAAPKEPAQKPPSPAGAASRAPAPAASASLPSVSPKSSMEMLRQLKSLKRHPTVMTQYVSERVPPALLQSLFSKSPIEADDLALVLECLRQAGKQASNQSRKQARKQ